MTYNPETLDLITLEEISLIGRAYFGGEPLTEAERVQLDTMMAKVRCAGAANDN